MTMKPDRNPAALKNNSGSESLSHKTYKLLGARPQHAMKRAARIPVLTTELMAGPEAEPLSVSCLLRGQYAMVSGEGWPSFGCCAILNLQMNLGFALEFWQRQYRHTSIFPHQESKLWDMKRKNFLFWDNRTISLVPEYITNRLFCSSHALQRNR